HNVISVLLIGGNEPVFHKERRPISSGGLGAPRPGGRDSRRCRQNDFGIISRDEFYSWPTRAAVAEQSLSIALRTCAVLLVIKVPANLLLKPGRNSDQRCHPVRLSRLARRHRIDPAGKGASATVKPAARPKHRSRRPLQSVLKPLIDPPRYISPNTSK